MRLAGFEPTTPWFVARHRQHLSLYASILPHGALSRETPESAAPNLPRSHPRENNFDGLRLLAALAVIVSHQFPLAGRPEPIFLTTLGGLGLSVFFGMSGYLVSTSWAADPHLGRFAARRLLRLWPALAAVCATGWAYAQLPVADPLLRLQLPLAGQLILRNAFLVFGYWDWGFFRGQPFGAWMGSAWSIPHEAALYLALAGVGVLLPRVWRLVPALVLPVLAFGASDSITVLPLLFVAGCVMRWGNRWSIVAALAIVVLRGHSSLAAELVIAVGACWVGPRSWPALRAGGRFGDLSYGLYLWGWPAQQFVIQALGVQTPLIVLLACSLGAALPLAAVSWHLLEAPALRFKPHRRPG